MKKIYRFLRIFFVVYIVKFLLRRFLKQPIPTQLEDSSTAEGQPRYSKESKRLWEDSPRCKDGISSNEFEYRSEFKNIKGEPVYYPTGERLNRVMPSFINRGGNLKSKRNGFFNAYPGGLNIDQYTGEIDISESDTGIRYVVEYTPCGKKCVTATNIVVSGIGYEGRVTNLSNSDPNDPNYFFSIPHYFGSTADQRNEVPSLEVPPGNFGMAPPNQKPDLQGLVIDSNTGAIDLKATVLNGALGFRKNDKYPENGTCKEFTIYYQLQSGPGKGILNKTSMRIHFYNKMADVPEELLVRINQQYHTIYRNSFSLVLLLGIAMTSVLDLTWEAIAALLATLTPLLFLNVSDTRNPCRPPEHVVIKALG